MDDQAKLETLHEWAVYQITEVHREIGQIVDGEGGASLQIERDRLRYLFGKRDILSSVIRRIANWRHDEEQK